jgi:hypothetical protein
LVVAVCSSTAEAIVDRVSLICAMSAGISLIAAFGTFDSGQNQLCPVP